MANSIVSTNIPPCPCGGECEPGKTTACVDCQRGPMVEPLAIFDSCRDYMNVRRAMRLRSSIKCAKCMKELTQFSGWGGLTLYKCDDCDMRIQITGIDALKEYPVNVQVGSCKTTVTRVRIKSANRVGPNNAKPWYSDFVGESLAIEYITGSGYVTRSGVVHFEDAEAVEEEG